MRGAWATDTLLKAGVVPVKRHRGEPGHTRTGIRPPSVIYINSPELVVTPYVPGTGTVQYTVRMSDNENAARAAATGDETTLRALLQRGVSANAKVLFSMQTVMNGVPARTPAAHLPLLLIAAQNGATPCVSVLLEARADPAVDVKIEAMGTALDCCFGFQRGLNRPSHCSYALDCAHLIIKARVNPSEYGRTPDGCTELMLACQDGQLTVARFLLDHGADPNLGKHNGSTALFKAAQEGYTDICRMLIHAHAHIDARFCSGATPLGVAACRGHVAVARLLLSMDADATVVATDGMNPADMAKCNGHAALAMILTKPLVEPPPNPLASGERVTVQGLQSKPELNGARAIVLEFDKTTGRYATMLLSGKEVALKPANVQPDLAGEAGPGSGVVESGRGHAAAPLTATTPVRPDEVWTLLSSGGGNVEHWADHLIRRCDFDLSHAFPTPPNQQAAGKTTHLLMLAAGTLRQKNLTGPVEATTCHLVGQPGLVRALLESRADANARTESGSTALHIACANCIVAHVALLLEHDADVNATDACGVSPLMQVVGTSKLATDETRLACIEILAASGKLEARAPPRLCGHRRRTLRFPHSEDFPLPTPRAHDDL